jgi:Protein of unknown function (DUF3313)
MRGLIYLARLMTIAGMVAAAAMLAALPIAAKDKSMQEWDGLVRKAGYQLDNVWVRPNVQFKAYKRVRLPPVEVTFSKDWDPNHGTRMLSSQVTREDMQNIRDGLSQMFHDEFAKRLAQGGYALADTNEDDVLIVQAALANLYINAPATNGASASRVYTMDAGRVSVVMQLSDAPTHQLLARVVDTQQGLSNGHWSWTTSVSNSAEARRIISIWADALRTALDKVNRQP